jgi:hypothetical protein
MLLKKFIPDVVKNELAGRVGWISLFKSIHCITDQDSWSIILYSSALHMMVKYLNLEYSVQKFSS